MKSSKIKAADDASFFCALVKIFRVWVDYKNGYFVKDPSAWLEAKIFYNCFYTWLVTFKLKTLGDSVPAVSVDGEAHSELLRGITCLVRAKESAISAIQLKSLCETVRVE